MRQRYVADELTHFLGRGLRPDEDAQYKLLVEILRSGKLRVGGLREGQEDQEGTVHTSYHHQRRLSDPEGPLFEPHVVCFCDIPLADLSLHMEKYGRFAISFRKEFLIGKGAAPADLLDELGPALIEAHSFKKDPANPTERVGPRELTRLEQFLEDAVLSYLKPFDEAKTEDDPHNFYMEREWRTRTSIHFSLEDVYRLILPEKYKIQLRQNTPGYLGQLTFV